MASSWIVEPVYVFEDRHFGLPPRFPWPPPNQLGLDGFEEGLDGCIIITISLAAHRHAEPVLSQDLLVIVRTVLGGFNRSSQHPNLGGVDDKNRQTKIRTVHAGQIILARATACLAT